MWSNANGHRVKRKWKNFNSRFVLLLILHEGSDNPAGQLARSLASQMDSLWVFLEEHGVEPTNNRAERSLRFGVIWRKRCFGCQCDKGRVGLSGFLHSRKPAASNPSPRSRSWSIWSKPIQKSKSLIWRGSIKVLAKYPVNDYCKFLQAGVQEIPRFVFAPIRQKPNML